MHTAPPEIDIAITRWMAAQGWPVTSRNHDFNRDIFAWRSESVRPDLTLYVTANVCEDTPPAKLLSYFAAAGLEKILRRDPDAYTLVLQNGRRELTIRQSAIRAGVDA